MTVETSSSSSPTSPATGTPNERSSLLRFADNTNSRKNHNRNSSTSTNVDEDAPASNSNDLQVDPTIRYVRTLQTLPWYQRPSVLWILPILITVSVGAGAQQVILRPFQQKLLCREYVNRYGSIGGGGDGDENGHDSFLSLLEQFGNMAWDMAVAGGVCNSAEVQSWVAKTLTIVDVLFGIGAIFSVGYWATLSDHRAGRLRVLAVSFVGTILGLLAIIVMDNYWDQIGLPVLVLDSLCRGLLGGVSLGITMHLAYAADCTVPAQRAKVYAFVHAALYFGLSIGPILGGWMVRASSIMSVVYMELVINVTALLLVIFVIPESLPAFQPEDIREQYFVHRKEPVLNSADQIAWYKHASRSLSIFRPNGRNTNLILLGSISFIQWLSTQGSTLIIVLYCSHKFGFEEWDFGVLFSIANTSRLVTLLILLPILVYFCKESIRQKKIKNLAVAQAAAIAAAAEASKNKKGKRPFMDGAIIEEESEERDQVQASAPIPREGDDEEYFFGNDEIDAHWDSDLETDVFDSNRGQPSVSTLSALVTGEAKAGSRTGGGYFRPMAAAAASRSATASIHEAADTDTHNAHDSVQAREDLNNALKLDTWILRTGFAINAITLVGYGLATRGEFFTLFCGLHAISVISTPSLKALLVMLVEPSKIGAVLGAFQVLDALGSTLSPMALNGIYAVSVTWLPEAVWYVLASWMGICFVLAVLIRQKKFRQSRPQDIFGS